MIASEDSKAEIKVKNGINICEKIKLHFVEIEITNLSIDIWLNISRELFKGVSNIALEYKVVILDEKVFVKKIKAVFTNAFMKIKIIKKTIIWIEFDNLTLVILSTIFGIKSIEQTSAIADKIVVNMQI